MSDNERTLFKVKHWAYAGVNRETDLPFKAIAVTFVYADKAENARDEMAKLKMLVHPDDVTSVTPASPDEVEAFHAGLNTGFRLA